MTLKRVLVLSLLAAACSGEGASGGGRGDAALDQKAYALCDGSDAVRLSLVSAGGGPLPDSAAFTHPHGWRFLHVDGHCNFVASTNVPGQILRGTFSAEQGVTLSETLGLEGMAGLDYRFEGLCPDAPSNVVMTPDAYVQSGCGDRDPPREVIAALEWESAFALADSVGRPSTTGAVSVLALRAGDGFGGATEWPFSFPIEEAAYDASEGGVPYEDIPKHAKTLTGEEAVFARQVWADTIAHPTWRGGYSVEIEGKSYLLYFRDELEPAFTQKIATLAAQSNGALPIAVCDPKRVLKSAPSTPSLYGQFLHATVPAESACRVELCWEGNFDEKSPVGAFVGLQKSVAPRTCLGEPSLSVRADLQPLIDAFHASYPGASVEIDLGFGMLYNADEEDVTCRKLSLERCAADARCHHIVGSLHDSGRHCTTPGVALGCMAKNLICTEALKGGQAPDGRRAVFGNGCIPTGWTPFYGEAPDYESLPVCDASTSLCTSSEQCSGGRYCTTEDGDCRSPCPAGSEACPTVCAGICRSR